MPGWAMIETSPQGGLSMRDTMPIVGLGIVGGVIVGLLSAMFIGAMPAIGIAVGAAAGLFAGALVELGRVEGR